MTKRSTPTGIWPLIAGKHLWIGLSILGGLILLVYFLFNSIWMSRYTLHDVTVQVPDVRDRSFEEARRILAQQDLRVEQVAERFNPTLPRDVVVDQSPAPSAMVKPGRRIFLTVNTGHAPMVTVPIVEDLSIREAENRLRAVGLRVSDMLADSIPSPYPNTVTRQKPAAGDSLARGAGVTLWYSTGLGSEYIEIPDLTNRTVAEARQTLLNLRLRPVVVGGGDIEDQAELEDEIIIRQSRDPGTRVREGQEIRIFIEEAEEQPELLQF